MRLNSSKTTGRQTGHKNPTNRWARGRRKGTWCRSAKLQCPGLLKVENRSRSLANSSMLTHQDQNCILSAEGRNNRKSAGPFSQENEYMGINFCHLPSTFFATDNSHSHFEQQRNSHHKKMALILHILKSFQEKKCSASKWKCLSMMLIRHFAASLPHLENR